MIRQISSVNLAQATSGCHSSIARDGFCAGLIGAYVRLLKLRCSRLPEINGRKHSDLS